MAGEIVRFEQPAQPVRRSFDEVQRMAEAISKSRLFGATSVEQVIALMLMAEAEGRHVASAMQDYSVIQGKPSLKAEAMLARFQQAGGKVKWTCLTDERVSAVFSHAQCDPVEIDWDIERAKKAGLGGKDMWRKFPRQMLRARVISEGVRTAYPGALGGFYAPEEVIEFEPAAVSPSRQAVAQSADPSVSAPTEAGAGNADSPAPVSSSVKASFTANSEDDGLGKGKSAYAARKDGDWERVRDRLMEELKECATRGEATVWWEGVVATDQEYRALPQSWRKTFRDEFYVPHMETLQDDAAPEVVWEDAE